MFVVIPTEGSMFTFFGVDTGFMRLQFDLSCVAGQQTHDKLWIQGHQSTAQLAVLWSACAIYQVSKQTKALQSKI